MTTNPPTPKAQGLKVGKGLTDGQKFTPPSPAQLLADLRWLLLSAPLIDETLYPGQVQCFSFSERAYIEAWLDQLPQERPELCATDFEMQHYQRLGRYAEKLLKFFLLNYPLANAGDAKAYQLIAHNLAINSHIAGGSTLGEIDFLVKDHQRQAWHWEMAVKFFACEPSAQRASSSSALTSEIIGPNRRDRLSLKIAKLFERQLRHRVPAPYEGEAWQAQAFAKGRIYYWLGEPAPDKSFHAGRAALNPNHERGFWCLGNEMHLIETYFPGTELYPLYRSEWLSPKSAATLDPERAYLAPKQPPEGQTLPLMIAVLRDRIEISRGFLLPEDHLLKPISV